MLERVYGIQPEADTSEEHDRPVGVPSLTSECEIDNELQAAIEYKIASSGVLGAATVMELLENALRRLVR